MFCENDERKALLLIDRVNRRYFSNVDVAEGFMLFGSKKVYFTDARYFYFAKELFSKSEIECELYTSNEKMFEYIKKLGVKEIYVDFENTNVSFYLELLKNFEVKNGKDYVDQKRSVKKQFEIDSAKRACEIAQRSYHHCIKQVKLGDSELDLKERIENQMKILGAEDVSFETIVAFGKNSAVPHHVSGDTKLENNACILVDMGCKVSGYCSDLTRMAYMGKPTEKFLKCYDAVLEANLLAEKEITDGFTFKQADGVARDYLKRFGLDQNFTHSLGHGVGLEIHEYPYLSPKRDGKLENGMVFSVEPGVYFDGEFGIRIEDTVYLTDGKVERLFDDEKNLIIL